MFSKYISMKSYLLFFLLLFVFSCTNNTTEEEEDMNFVIWDGPQVEFVKISEADPNLIENQDSISPSVQITRGVNGGQIYNLVSENSADKDASPRGTRWAEGDIEDIADLNFEPFRAAVGNPKNVTGKKLVLHLVAEDVYLPSEFTSWEANKGGGFSYTRATE